MIYWIIYIDLPKSSENISSCIIDELVKVNKIKIAPEIKSIIPIPINDSNKLAFFLEVTYPQSE